VAGYGPKKALKLAQQHLGWDETLRAAVIEPSSVADVAELFRHPATIEVPAPSFGPVNEDELLRLLADAHGFSPERVRAAVRRARQRPAPATSASETKGRQALLDSFGGSEA
jgi:hypothetical protein